MLLIVQLMPLLPIIVMMPGDVCAIHLPGLTILRVLNLRYLWLVGVLRGHEHLPWFNLINMNGRVYDPLIAEFLSPDNYVQNPDLNYRLYSQIFFGFLAADKIP